MLYHLHDLNYAALTPLRLGAETIMHMSKNPFFPFAHSPWGKSMAAGSELIHRMTKRYGKPEFGLPTTKIGDKEVEVIEETIMKKAFCDLIHFKRTVKRKDPKLLIVAPVSGHYATLLRGTVKALLPNHEVYITDWKDARMVPLSEGVFGLDDYIQYVIDFINKLGSDVHVMAVCQPAVPVLAAVAYMAQTNHKKQPLSMTLMGGPIDARVADTEVTRLAAERPLSWFENNVVATVPVYYPGAFRRVYPGFLQLTGFMQMNLERHVNQHIKLFEHLVTGDGDSAEAHKKFYDEYLAVMDLPAKFYLETVEHVFQKFSLPKGEYVFKGETLDLKQIKKTAILAVEGELDDISAVGQTKAVIDLCSGVPKDKREYHLQDSVGHYGIFNGRRWRGYIMPRVRDFIRKHDTEKSPITVANAEQKVLDGEKL
ncbi:MAG: poly(3-hydroxybutyrate) depolymerase [Rickettsiales bacterium]|nr:poly(3-hydroxybutyrate) depolymerase [Rickettsiales bacterium]